MSKIISIATTSPAYKAAHKVLDGYRNTFSTLAAAISKLQAIYSLEGFPKEFPVLAAGVGAIDVTGSDSIPPLADFPEEYRLEGVTIAVSFIGVRGLEAEGKSVNGARGFAIMPLPSIEAIQADSSGPAWLNKVAEKELSHVAFRGLRNVESSLGLDALEAAAKQMPLSVSDFVEASTSDSIDTTAFDKLWATFRKLLANNPNTSGLVPALPGKADVVKSIRSKAYATEEYADLEKMGIFAWIGETMAQLIDNVNEEALSKGEETELDSSEIRAWIVGRNAKVFSTRTKPEADLSKVNLAGFMSGLAGETNESSDTTTETASGFEAGASA